MYIKISNMCTQYRIKLRIRYYDLCLRFFLFVTIRMSVLISNIMLLSDQDVSLPNIKTIQESKRESLVPILSTQKSAKFDLKKFIKKSFERLHSTFSEDQKQLLKDKKIKTDVFF